MGPAGQDQPASRSGCRGDRDAAERASDDAKRRINRRSTTHSTGPVPRIVGSNATDQVMVVPPADAAPAPHEVRRLLGSPVGVSRTSARYARTGNPRTTE